MSMGAVLRQVRDHLRGAMPLAADQCGVQPAALPPESAGELYVAVDEVGVQSAARAHLSETYEIEVAVWRRAGQYPADRRGDAQLRDDPHLAGILTLDDAERAVIRHLHGNYLDVTAAASAAIGAGTSGNGDVFQLALYYQGRGRTEEHPPRGRHQVAAWLGRRLRFAGMTRVQARDLMR
jgi:hypothetical protein